MRLELKILDERATIPEYQSSGAAAVDLHAIEDTVLAPQQRVKLRTGIAIHIGSDESAMTTRSMLWNNPDIYSAAIIVPRSGRGTEGLILANTIGVIDACYQGELIISAWNSTKGKNIFIAAGARIAQMMFIPVIKVAFDVVNEFTKITDRGDGGFGSTGV